jgi:hypothetical protein
MQLVIVSAVPFISAGAFQQLRWIAGESDTTTITQKSKKSKKKFVDVM